MSRNKTTVSGGCSASRWSSWSGRGERRRFEPSAQAIRDAGERTDGLCTRIATMARLFGVSPSASCSTHVEARATMCSRSSKGGTTTWLRHSAYLRVASELQGPHRSTLQPGNRYCFLEVSR